jgi:hypothetical protein
MGLAMEASPNSPNFLGVADVELSHALIEQLELVWLTRE